MFLKTQEDLDKLLIEYPIDAYSISIHWWKDGRHPYFGITSDNLFISSEENNIFLTIYNDKYEYSNKWIQVINIFKKTKQSEWLAREFPIVLNWRSLVDKNLTEAKLSKLYDEIEEFRNNYDWLKEQLRLLDRLELDEIFRNWEQLSHNSDMHVFYSFYQQSQSDYFASQYCKLIDKDTRAFNFNNIIEKAKNQDILEKNIYLKIIKELNAFKSKNKYIVEYRNQYWAHHDIRGFYKYNKSVRISATWVQRTRSIIEPTIFREKLKELMDFIDKTINDYFSPQVRFWRWWDSWRQFTLKIIQKN